MYNPGQSLSSETKNFVKALKNDQISYLSFRKNLASISSTGLKIFYERSWLIISAAFTATEILKWVILTAYSYYNMLNSMVMLIGPVLGWKYLFWHVQSKKNQNLLFKIKPDTNTTLNMLNLMLMFVFPAFDTFLG